jgi:cobaltochelatase CobN
VRTCRAALVLNTTAFAARRIDNPAPQPLAGDAPVLQVIVSGGNREDWLADNQGLRPRDIAMQISLPEMDGRIITRAISFKGLSLSLTHSRRSTWCAISPSPTASPSSPS